MYVCLSVPSIDSSSDVRRFAAELGAAGARGYRSISAGGAVYRLSIDIRRHRRIQPIMLGGDNLPRVRGEDRRARVRDPKGRERGQGSWGGAAIQLGVWGVLQVQGGAPATKMFSYILEAPRVAR